MKIRIIANKENKLAAVYAEAKNRGVWGRWFAWYPVFFDGNLVWLEMIERRHHYLHKYDYWEAEYRRPDHTQKR